MEEQLKQFVLENAGFFMLDWYENQYGASLNSYYFTVRLHLFGWRLSVGKKFYSEYVFSTYFFGYEFHREIRKRKKIQQLASKNLKDKKRSEFKKELENNIKEWVK